MIHFIKNIPESKDVKLTRASVSHLKHRDTITRAVPRNVENETFVKHLKEQIPTFDEESFFKELSTESRKKARAQRKLVNNN